MASYRINWRNSAIRELRRLDRTVVPQIINAVENLAQNPCPSGCRKLVGTDHSYRICLGDYRIIYDLSASKLTVYIVRVRHRREAYR